MGADGGGCDYCVGVDEDSYLLAQDDIRPATALRIHAQLRIDQDQNCRKHEPPLPPAPKNPPKLLKPRLQHLHHLLPQKHHLHLDQPPKKLHPPLHLIPRLRSPNLPILLTHLGSQKLHRRQHPLLRPQPRRLPISIRPERMEVDARICDRFRVYGCEFGSGVGGAGVSAVCGGFGGGCAICGEVSAWGRDWGQV